MKDSKTEKATKAIPGRRETVTALPIPPDGGWSWIVMMASFMMSVLVDGICLNIGVFFPHFLDYFQDSKARTSIAGAVLNATRLFVGPIASAFTHRYGCRKVAIVGSVISSVAFFLATFSPSVDVLIVFYGAIGGFGVGLMHLPAIVMVGYYFEEKRAFATGVAVCGSGIGLFVFAPLSEYLLREYGWKGALWIISAIMLHGAIFGATYRPLKPRLLKGANQITMYMKKDEFSANTEIFTDGSMNIPLIKSRVLTHNVISRPSNQLVIEYGGVLPETQFRKQSFVEDRSISDECVVTATKADSATRVRRLTKSQDVAASTNIERRDHEIYRMAEKQFRQLYTKDIFYSGSVRSLPGYPLDRDSGVYESNNIQLLQHTDPVEEVEEKSKCWKFSTGTTKVFKDMMGFSLLASPTFLTYGVSGFLAILGYVVPFAYIPAQAMTTGVDSRKAAFLLSITGITNTVGRIISGLVSDRTWADCVLISNAALISSGVLTLLVPFFTNYGLLAAYSTLYGLTIAAYLALPSVILVELLGLDNLASALGLLSLCQGISSYLSPPIAGAIADSTGNYNAAFYMAGCSLALAGLIGLPLRKISKWEKIRKVTKILPKNEKTGKRVAMVT